MFDDDPLITREFRDRQRAPNIFVFARPAAAAGGSQEVAYTIKLRPRGDF